MNYNLNPDDMKKLIFGILLTVSFAFVMNSTYAQKRSDLHEPAARGDLVAVKEIIEKKGKVDKKDIAGQTALMYAAEAGKMNVVVYLVEQGADVNAMSGKQGRGTPLIYATAANQIEVVEYLLKHGANINATTPYYKETALVWATAIGSTQLVKILLENGADLNVETRNGETAMDMAITTNNQEIISLLKGEEQ